MRGWVWFTAHECMVEDWAVTNWFITEENDLPGLQNRFLGLRIMIMGAKTKFVQCPDGELQKRKEVVHCVTLPEIDVINSTSMCSQDNPLYLLEPRLRQRNVTDPSHKIRGTNQKSPHGIPIDLLDRLLIITTQPYTDEDIRKILEIRCQEEDVEMNEEAKQLLTLIGRDTSLRTQKTNWNYTFLQTWKQMHNGKDNDGKVIHPYLLTHHITAVALSCQKRKGKVVEIEDTNRVYRLFLDARRSMQYLVEYQSQYMFSEVPSQSD
ncbi:hypothetical protein Bca52824_060710 [Brassica carinata]|uniref:RuvB-like helicase n=1 Tax=Brassica carinata TaxID=52824 RepID=A0A8X7R0G9_BRACI|nr:hypothetical protein Bca52824_060710 [Brassica carinata]